MSPAAARRIGRRPGLPWRRAHGKRRLAADEERNSRWNWTATAERAKGGRDKRRRIEREDVINADAPASHRRGPEASQASGRGSLNPIHGNGKVAHTAMVAIRAALTKRLIGGIAERKSIQAETALAAADALSWDSDHAQSGWTSVATALGVFANTARGSVPRAVVVC
jgi:hypothetical protein